MFFRKKIKTRPTHSRRNLYFEGHSIPYDLVRSDRRTLALQVRRDGSIVVRAPKRLSEKDIINWIKERHEWIEKHRKNFKINYPPSLKFISGEHHFFLGQSYRLEIINDTRSQVNLHNDSLIVKARHVDDAKKTERLIKNFYRKQAFKLFPAYIDEAFSAFEDMGYKKPSLKLRWMKRHWGSLSSKGVMTLNTKLIRAPRHLIDYVIFHELCHLAYMNHGKEFYELMGKMMPDWKKRKKALEVFMI